MNTTQLRRQFWLILLLAGVAYLWWQSSAPDRYEEVPSPNGTRVHLPSPALMGDDGVDHPLRMSSADTLHYADTGSAVRVTVIRSMQGDTCRASIEWTDGDSTISKCDAVMRSGYAPLVLNLWRGADRFEVTMDGGTLRTERMSTPPSVVSWPLEPGLIFEDLLLLQMPFWRGEPAVTATSMAVFTDRSVPMGMVKVEVIAQGDSALEIVSEYGRKVRAEFAPRSIWVQSFQSPNGHHLKLMEHRGGES